ncbi:hypothetical protein TPY_1931 [Sulfobacillus acidophilus TPY]|nr:hypothetical protein TPY_1931 [Sulfobacillus acidophilus TPY]
MTHDDIQLNLPIWAASGLPTDDQDAILSHLEACKECRSAWQDYQAILSHLQPTTVEPDWQGHAAMREAFQARLQGTGSPTRRRFRVGPWLGWAAAVILAVSGWGVAYRYHQEALQKDAILALMSQGQVVELSSPVSGAYHAVLVVRGNRAVIWATHLPSLPPAHVYEGWWIVRGKPLPAGLFTKRPDVLPPRPRNASVFAITVEPAGGTAQPTSPVLVMGTVR